MCGIFGLLALSGRLDPEKYSLPNETSVLRHRGPDAFGCFLDEHAYLAHRRLSIIDLSSGNQPVYNEDRSVCVVFNGEIFNFQEIRDELAAKGHAFTTNSDTEVIVHSYEEYGKACVDRFRGMFAFAIWDARSKTLFLARDRLGIKPVFYAIRNDVLYFASEMKAILQYPDFPREMDYDGLASYFTLSYIPDPLTIFAHIRKLSPGHTMTVAGGRISIEQYWDLSFSPDGMRQDYYIEGLMDILNESVKLRMISDVPLGAFLSGGIDSGAIVAAMAKVSSDPVRTFCIGFGGNVGGYLDERGYAREVAQQYESIHREYEVTPDFYGLIEDIVTSFDEPFGDSGAVPTYYVCEAARREVTVALSGLGGDELFGGYERYLGFHYSRLYNHLPTFLRESVIRPLVETLPERADGHYTVNHLKRFVRSGSLPEDSRYFGFISMLGKDKKDNLFAEPERYADNFRACQDLVLRHFNAPNAEDPLDKVFYCDIKTYLPDDILTCTDRMSMRHSLEVRVPFLDHKFVEFCATIPSSMKVRFQDKKHIFKQALGGVLPKSVLNHRKQGFIGPMTKWLQTDLKARFKTFSASGTSPSTASSITTSSEMPWTSTSTGSRSTTS
jgi:asparagine synthase (glutamine-hydrolysing)